MRPDNKTLSNEFEALRKRGDRWDRSENVKISIVTELFILDPLAFLMRIALSQESSLIYVQ